MVHTFSWGRIVLPGAAEHLPDEWTGRSMEAQEEVRRVREALRNLQRTARRWRSYHSRILQPTLRMQFIAVVVYRLCQDAALAVFWCHRQMERARKHMLHSLRRVGVMDIQSWTARLGGDPEVEKAMQDLGHPWRHEADVFLIESLVADDVRQANSQGMQLGSQLLLQSLLRKWNLRPRSPAIDQWLAQLVADECKQRHWRRRFRQRWDLRWGQLRGHRTLSCNEIRSRAAILIRWCRWLLRTVLATRNVVVINMDETGVSNVKEARSGYVISRAGSASLNNAGSCKSKSHPRCSVLASICDDSALQSSMPQIFLPRQRQGRPPSREMQGVFTAAGTPVEAWHGSSGFVTTECVLAYLTCVRRAVRRVRPEATIVLVFDTCGAHINARVFRKARLLGIYIILIPGRMTWVLQPLDTHVFAQLKRCLRVGLQKARLQQPTGALPYHASMEVSAACVREVLVNRDWSAVMKRSGLSQADVPLRSNLAQLLEGENVQPQAPNVEELATITGGSSSWASRLRTLLLAHLEASSSLGSDGQEGPPQAHTNADVEIDDGILRPLLHAPRRSMDSRVAPSAAPAGPASLASVPRARRLLWFPQNHQLRPVTTRPDAARVATRSQNRALTPGFLEQESQQRRKRARDANA